MLKEMELEKTIVHSSDLIESIFCVRVGAKSDCSGWCQCKLREMRIVIQRTFLKIKVLRDMVT